ncbi:ferredoxin [Actinacidiphila paucisporea]|uniref:Ferredoxin n=1 Tax=Actinacidiphila paucisporea TaxID=310782 RepID=A0A1M7FMT3_9ACTN|nr:ferredoxin [Actinacidiphila paucisporea]SHM05354.1 Ferredoxin [Actinacidiphila paucisporea]
MSAPAVRRAVVDRDVCVGAGQCVLAAPDVFDQSDEDGLSYVLVDPLPEELTPSVRDAATRCPARAVQLEAGAGAGAETGAAAETGTGADPAADRQPTGPSPA